MSGHPALLAYLNHRLFGLPTTIGVMVVALSLSLILLGLDAVGLDQGLRDYEESLLRSIDFSSVLMQGMLSLLLFAGALHVDLSELRAYRWQVGVLAVVSTLASTALIGFVMSLALPWVGLELPLLYCLLFGALISPTDPIAVMGILKTAGAPKNLELVIAGESLFNDGVGVVSFFSTMKTERLNRKVYRTRDAARADVFDYIERFYNHQRRHSTLDFVSPVQFEQGLMG